MVKKRGEVYYLRLHVPADVQNVIGCKSLVRTLRTGRAREANMRASTLNANIQGLWRQVRLMIRKLNPSEIKAMVKAWLDGELEQYADPMCSPIWLTSSKDIDEFELLLDELSDRRARLATALRSPAKGYHALDENLLLGAPNDGPEISACHEIAGRLLSQLGGDGVDEESRLILVRHIAEAMLKINQAQVKTARTVFGLPDVPASLQSQPSSALVTNESSPLLSSVIDAWIDEAEIVKNCKTSTMMAYRSYKPKILELFGDRPVNSIVRADIVKAIERLKNSGLSRGSINKYITGIAMVMKFAEKSNFIVRSPMPAKSTKKQISNKNSDDEKYRLKFSDEELERFFALPEFSDRVKVVKHPQKYWIPLISLFSGMRLNECAQLYLKDIREVGGVLCFDVNEDDEGKSVKSESSHRLVPVHSKLIDLGLIDYLEAVRSGGHDRLFPELEQGCKGTFGEAIGKALNRLIQKVTERPKGEHPVFHSLRKRFSTGLLTAGVDKLHIVELMGHHDDMATTTGYSGNFPPEMLKVDIEKLVVPAINHLKRWKKF